MDVQALALIGAKARLTQIHTEIAALHAFLSDDAPRPRRRRAMHWTQRPENAVKLANARLRAVITRQRRHGQ